METKVTSNLQKYSFLEKSSDNEKILFESNELFFKLEKDNKLLEMLVDQDFENLFFKCGYEELLIEQCFTVIVNVKDVGSFNFVFKNKDFNLDKLKSDLLVLKSIDAESDELKKDKLIKMLNIVGDYSPIYAYTIKYINLLESIEVRYPLLMKAKDKPSALAIKLKEIKEDYLANKEERRKQREAKAIQRALEKQKAEELRKAQQALKAEKARELKKVQKVEKAPKVEKSPKVEKIKKVKIPKVKVIKEKKPSEFLYELKASFKSIDTLLTVVSCLLKVVSASFMLSLFFEKNTLAYIFVILLIAYLALDSYLMYYNFLDSKKKEHNKFLPVLSCIFSLPGFGAGFGIFVLVGSFVKKIEPVDRMWTSLYIGIGIAVVIFILGSVIGLILSKILPQRNKK